MRKPEQQLWDWLDRKLGGMAFLHRVENRVRVGTPDLYLGCRGVCGWVELKALAKWPAAGRPVVIANWTAQQRAFAKDLKRLGGGRTWIMVQVGRGEIIVGDAAVWAVLDEDPTEEEIRAVWTVLKRDCSTTDVIEALKKD